MSDDTMRDDLNAAIELLDGDDDEQETESPAPDVPLDTRSSGDDDSSSVVTDPVSLAPATVSSDSDEDSTRGVHRDSDSSSASERGTTATRLKAPAGWTPQQREQWSKIPQDIQEHIAARETEMADSIANTATSRATHDRMETLAKSYAPIMAAEGVSDPVQAAEGLFQTVSQLRMGNAQQKAQTIAQLVSYYGVDVGALDNALVGKDTPASPNADVERMLEEKMQPFNHMMQLLEQAKGEQVNQTKVNAEKAVKDFAANAEFLGDVRNDMADLIDLAHKRGVDMPLQEAYDKAVAMSPEINKVLEQRKLMERNSTVQAKRTAASSLNGKRSGVDAPPSGGGSMRDDIMAAFDSMSN